jgi:Transcriptional regulators
MYLGMVTDTPDLDAIAAALAQLRGRAPFGPGGARRGTPPWAAGDAEHGGHQHEHEHPGHGDRPHGRGRFGGPGPFGHGPFGHGPFGPGFAPGPHARFGGGPARLRMLEALAAASHPLSVSEVGEAIGVDQPRASRLIQQAVAMGLVRREADPDDARRTRIALTEEGARVARGFRGERRERLQRALADFTDDERTELARLLTKLAAAWPDA